MCTGSRFLGPLGLLLLSGCLLESEPAKKPEADKKDKPPTFKVEKGPLKNEVVLKGVFESGDMAEVAVPSELWVPEVRGALTVLQAVEHGTAVHRGDTLVRLDLARIDQAIKDLESERQLTDLAIKQAEEELPVLEKTLPLELAAAERSKKIADEDLQRHVETERAFLEKTAQYEVKSAANYLQYAKEELRQLEKMYRAKDLTEETEEIILKRQRDAVERSQFYLQSAELDRDLALKLLLPRRDVSMRENAQKQALALDKAKATLPLAVRQKHLALAKLRYDRDKAGDKLSKLQKDRAVMTVKSPADGIVYYGKCSRGQWSTASGMASRLLRGGTVSADEVILTVVKPRPQFVRAAVEEKDLHLLRCGMPVKAVPVPYPDLKVPAKVAELSAIPVTPGNFEARVSLDLPQDAPAVVPGMACSVKVVAYAKPDALTLPSSAVFVEELDEDSHYVYLPSKDGVPEKRPVVIGRQSGDKTEVLKGLHEGDEVLQQKPDPAKKADAPAKKG
jgi:multidrug resistance efflux pump